MIEDSDRQILEARCTHSTRSKTAFNHDLVLEYMPPDTPTDLKAAILSLNHNSLVSKVPSDNRIQLVFDLQRILNAEKVLLNFNSPDVQNTEERMQKLREFEDRGNSLDPELFDFCVLDHVPSPETGTIRRAAYRMGHGCYFFSSDNETNAANPAFQQEETEAFVAPWRRVIVCKGLSAVTRPGTSIDSKSAKEVLPCIDMTGGTLSLASKDFARSVTDASIAEAIQLHMTCTKRTGGDRINPYLDASRAFHITFYETIIHRFRSSGGEFWKTGPFYIRPGAPWFRRSAITTLVVTEDGYAAGEKALRQKLSPQWGTILVLCPSETRQWFNLYTKQNVFPRQWKTVLDIGQIQVGEVAVIKEAYTMVTSRWLNLMDYVADLLREDFMDPEKYIKLIFDDDQLSTSKKYFWILACMQEFRSSIMDNISQWSLYYKARIEPFPEDHTPELKALINQIEESCSTLDGIKRQIDDTVETVKGRRDGLFNASALSETRITNRLGQNVKLLTYVSIFYLPLAFCAAVWAIPNIDMSGTKTAFSVTALLLGIVNFLVVANVGNLSRLLGGIYKVWRTRIVQQMKDDPKGNMNQMGRNLENSWPERFTGPSEWLILRYQIIKSFRWIRSYFRRRRVKRDDSCKFPIRERSESSPSEIRHIDFMIAPWEDMNL